MKKALTKLAYGAALMLVLLNSSYAGNWVNYSNYIQATCLAKRGNELWLSDKSGLLMVNSTTGEKTFFKKSPTELPSLTVERVQVHPITNDIWIGTYDNGLAMLHNNTWTHIPFPIAGAMLYEMKIAADGTVWSATTEGIYKYQNGTFTNYLGGFNQAPWDIELLSNGKILCASNMPYIFDPATLHIQEIPSTVIAYGFSRVIAENDHHFFFSTDHNELAEFNDTIEADTFDIGYAADMQFNAAGNLVVLENKTLHEKTGSYFTTLAFGNNSLTAFLALPNGEMWGANSEPDNTLFHLNSANQSSTTDIRQCGLNDNWVADINNTADGNVLLVSRNNVQKFNLASQTFSDVALDTLAAMNLNNVIEANGKLYAGTSYSYFYEYTPGSGWQQKGNGILPHAEVKKFDTDAQGNLWMCGYGYVAKYDGTNLTVYDAGNNPQLVQYMRDIHCDKTRNLVWFASYDGIFKLDNGTISFYNDSTAGIQQYYDAVETIDEDNAHNIWFGTVYGGLVKYDGNSFSTMLLPQTAGNQFVSDIAFNGSTMYVSDNLFGVWIYENNQWDSLNMSNSAITDNYVSALNVDANGNLWIGHLSHGADVYNKSGVALQVPEIKSDLATCIFPNPNNGKFQLQWNTDENADISIYNAEGKQVLALHNASNLNSINLSGQSSGLYIAEVKTNTTFQRVKVLVK